MTASTSDMTFRNAFAVFCREVTGPHAGKIVFCFWTDEKGREFWEGPGYTVIPRDELIDASNLRDADILSSAFCDCSELEDATSVAIVE